ncbi:hypothetical protein [Kribbella sp. NPDC049227]|uniref:hypothetical protein n=1 Tax=Kribbella sp. NPDC049227 TaxID=3364113 RepID=UPI0037174780
MSDPFSDPDEAMSDADDALARLTTRTYITKKSPPPREVQVRKQFPTVTSDGQ